MLSTVPAQERRVRTVRTLEVLFSFFRVRAFDMIPESAVVFVLGIAMRAHFLFSGVTSLPMSLHHQTRLVPGKYMEDKKIMTSL